MAKKALVMSGGGAKGAFQLGAVDYLITEGGLDFDVISGVSVGSLNAVMLAQGKGPEGLKQQLAVLKKFWLSMEGNGDVYNKRFLGELLVFVLNDSIYDPKPIKQQIDAKVSEARLRASGREFRIGAVSLDSGKYRVIDQNASSIADWVLASSSMPVFFPPVTIGADHAVDGGVRNITPLAESFRALKKIDPCTIDVDEENEMYVLLASPLGVDPKGGTNWCPGLTVAERAIELLTNEIFLEDLSYALAVNDSVRAHADTHRLLSRRGQLDQEALNLLDSFPFRFPDYCPVTIKTIIPSTNYSDALEFDPAKIRTAYNAGRKAAEAEVLSEKEVKERLKNLADQQTGG